ncbi:PLP-dependent aminotransferase family protein [bacterium]|nr:PLP-dependent aminotransferase family protein [bacterium]
MLRFSRSSDALQSSAVRELMKAASNPDMISFSGGMPNPGLFPVQELDEIISALPLRAKQDGFQYGPTPGYPPLLESLSAYLRSKGLPVDDNGLIITAGSLQAIHLVTKVFIDPGDTVVTETPCFVGAIPVFRYFQAALRGVPLDSDGPMLRDLKQTLEEEKPTLLYLTPYFHNPAGIVYSAERKASVMNLVKGRDIPLLEDDAYGELYFDEKDKPLTVPMKVSADPSIPICYTGSFSKIFGPGMRLGWLLGPKDVTARCELAKQGVDACSSTYTQVLADAFLRGGYLPAYLERLRKAYARRCQIMTEALKALMPEGVKWNAPKGGFYLWLQLPEGMNATALLEIAAARGAVFVVGRAFDPEGQKDDCLRLSFSHTPEERIAEGVRILAESMAVLSGKSSR